MSFIEIEKDKGTTAAIKIAAAKLIFLVLPNMHSARYTDQIISSAVRFTHFAILHNVSLTMGMVNRKLPKQLWFSIDRFPGSVTQL